MALEGFESFLKSGAGSSNFSDALELAVAEELQSRTPIEEYPISDSYRISRLGFVVADELARVISVSDASFDYNVPEANIFVPTWVKRANVKFKGHPFAMFAFNLYDPSTEPLDHIQSDAVEMAESCVQNSLIAIRDTNIVARSAVNALRDFGAEEPVARVLRNSSALIARMATLNDTSSGGTKNEFYYEVGLEDSTEGFIDPVYLAYDSASRTIDLTEEARKTMRDFVNAGGGCPALRARVTWRGEDKPMIAAFWDGAIDVIQKRIPPLI